MQIGSASLSSCWWCQSGRSSRLPADSRPSWWSFPTSSFVCSGGDAMKKAAGRDRHAAAMARTHAQNLHHVPTWWCAGWLERFSRTSGIAFFVFMRPFGAEPTGSAATAWKVPLAVMLLIVTLEENEMTCIFPPSGKASCEFLWSYLLFKKCLPVLRKLVLMKHRC